MRLPLAPLLLAAFAVPAQAHDFTITQVLVVLQEDTYQIDVSVDADALALGLPPSADSAEVAAEMEALPAEDFDAAVAQAQRSMQRLTRIRFDGQKQIPDVAFPHYGTPVAEQAEVPTVLGTVARLSGPVPDAASAFTFGASRVFKAVQMTVFDATSGQTSFALGVGEDSPPIELGAVRQSGAGKTALQYLQLGFEHIVPKGLDHILFVLGLFLLSARAKPLLWQITAFTVAHSLTLALSMLGIVALPASIVEPLIAVSIAYVAIENIATSELKPWRPAVVFAFGLLHGLGFAGVLAELGLPSGEFLPALLGFNLGVELGQLAVVAGAFVAVGWWSSRPGYRRWVVIPGSAVIALVGVYWAIERAFAG